MIIEITDRDEALNMLNGIEDGQEDATFIKLIIEAN